MRSKVRDSPHEASPKEDSRCNLLLGQLVIKCGCGEGKSAEGKAAEMIRTLCTFAAVRIILAQEEGYDNEGGTRTQQSTDLVDMLDQEPMRNGSE